MPTDVKNDVTLTLFIPDLFALQSVFSQIPKNEIPRLPVLERWISRGIPGKAGIQDKLDLHETIFTELGISSDEMKNSIPLSAFSLLAEDSDIVSNEPEVTVPGYWLRADPVCIQPDRDTAVVIAHEELALSLEEAKKLVEEINSHFENEPWELHVVQPHRWYLKHVHVQELDTTALQQVLGQDINQSLPRGKDAGYWLQCSNEIQMLLHGTNINFERESRGQWTVNSIWLWGGGVLPGNRNIKTAHTKIITNDIVLQGIGRYYGIDVIAFDDDYLEKIQSGNSFMLLDVMSEAVSGRDIYAYIQQLQTLEAHYFKNIDSLVKQGKIKQLRLLSDKHTITITSKSLRRWWKRHKSFAEF